jgi:aquaporin related protein
LALFIAELVGVYYTGGSLNPARSFGPCVVAGVFDREHWIYCTSISLPHPLILLSNTNMRTGVGPAIGAVLAVVFYNFIKVLEYEMANPDQDANEDDIKEKEEQEGA